MCNFSTLLFKVINIVILKNIINKFTCFTFKKSCIAFQEKVVFEYFNIMSAA